MVTLISISGELAQLSNDFEPDIFSPEFPTVFVVSPEILEGVKLSTDQLDGKQMATHAFGLRF